MRRCGAILVALSVAAVAVAQQPVVPIPPVGPVALPAGPVWQPPPPSKPFPVHLITPWWIVIVVVVAQQQRKTQEEEEEEVTAPIDTAEYEYKILRSAFGAFKKPDKFRAALAEEARFGWELVEKFDDSRVRLRRPISCRATDPADPAGSPDADPYRIRFGSGEGAMVVWIILAVLLGVAAVLGIVFLITGGR